jgi:hypothetical protein
MIDWEYIDDTYDDMPRQEFIRSSKPERPYSEPVRKVKIKRDASHKHAPEWL